MAMTYPDGRIVDYTRDALGRITGIQATIDGRSASLLSQVTYRADGRLRTQTFGNELTGTRRYDPVGRLVQQFIGSAGPGIGSTNTEVGAPSRFDLRMAYSENLVRHTPVVRQDAITY